MNVNMDNVQSWKFPGWDIGLRCILFGFAMLSTVSCNSTTNMSTERVSTTYNATVLRTNVSEMTIMTIPSTQAAKSPFDPIPTLSIASSLLAILIMITVCVWILTLRKRGREHNVAWSPPPINVHLHGVGSHSLSRTPSHYRSHRTMSEYDQDQPPAENKSSGHMYNVIDNSAPGQTQVDNTGLPTTDGKKPKDDDGVSSKQISGKVSDPFPMIPNPLYRTTSCMMERRGPMPLPPVGHRSIGHSPRKGPPQERYAPTRDMSEPLEAKTQAISGNGCSGNQPDSVIHSVRSKSCDPLRIPDQPAKETSDQPQWSLLDSLDTFEKLGGLDTPSLNDVFGEPEYSLVENPSGRPRSYSLFHLPTKSSFGQGPNQAFEMVSRRNRSRTSCSKELGGSFLAQTSERYEMVENPLYPSSSYNPLDRPEKRRTRKRDTEGGGLGSRSSEKKSSQRGIDDEGYHTILDPGGEHCSVDIGYKDLK